MQSARSRMFHILPQHWKKERDIRVHKRITTHKLIKFAKCKTRGNEWQDVCEFKCRFLKNVTDSTKPDDWIWPDTTTCELLYGWWMLLNAADYYYYSFISQAFVHITSDMILGCHRGGLFSMCFPLYNPSKREQSWIEHSNTWWSKSCLAAIFQA